MFTTSVLKHRSSLFISRALKESKLKCSKRYFTETTKFGPSDKHIMNISNTLQQKNFKFEKLNHLEEYKEDFMKISNNIKEIINPDANHHYYLNVIYTNYFQNCERNLFSTLILTISKLLSENYHQNSDTIQEKHRKLAEIVELINASMIIHDSVIDFDNNLTLENEDYKSYNKISILCGDLLLAKASILLSKIRNFNVTELISTSISDIIESKYQNNENSLNIINQKVDEIIKPAEVSLLSNSFQCCALLYGKDQQTIDKYYQIGWNLGMSIYLMNEINQPLLPYNYENAFQPHIPTPFLLASQSDQKLKEILSQKRKSKEEIDYAYFAVENSSSRQKTVDIAKYYSQRALPNLTELSEDSKYNQIIIDCCNELLSKEI